MKLFGDGTVCVAVGGQLWTFSPSCLVAYRPEEDANLDVAERARESKGAGTRPWQPVGGGAAPSQPEISAPPTGSIHPPPFSLKCSFFDVSIKHHHLQEALPAALCSEGPASGGCSAATTWELLVCTEP